MSTWVVDASVGLKWCLDEVDSDRAALLLNALLEGSAELVVPDLFFLECGNTFWKSVVRKTLDAGSATGNLDLLLALPLRVVSSKELAEASLAIALESEATAYDASYVALAEKEGCTLITADERLVGKVGKRPCRVKVLSKLVPQDLVG